MKPSWKVILVGMLLLLAACQSPSQPPPSGESSLEPTEYNGRPAARLPDGSIVTLLLPEEIREAREYYRLLLEEQEEQAEPATLLRPASLPSRVDLRPNQTPIRNQWQRGTCTSFANVALIEAFYKKTYGLDLDLSEQYANHVQKMGILLNPSPALPRRENGLGMWGGGGVAWGLEHLKTYRLTLERSLPYIPFGNYENTEQPGDVPFARWQDSETHLQRDFGDFNLSDRPTVYYIPERLEVASLPQEALNTAVYGPVRVRYATEDELRSLDWFKTQLAAGREVAFAVLLTRPVSCGSLPRNDPCYDQQWREQGEEFRGGIWRPLSTDLGGHAMLMVGYDDTRQAFMVKNSWGRNGAGKGRPAGADTDGDGFILMSYDWVTRGKVYEAAVLMEAISPIDILSAPHPPRFLGRWKMNHDGWRGVFDLYHLPGTVHPRWLGGRLDLRLGTYYGPDGVARRVNGLILGNRIDFWIDWGTPDLAVNQLQGMRFTGYLMVGNRYLAGTMLDNRDGRTYGFYLTKEEYLSGRGVPGPVAPASYVGRWVVNDNSRVGHLTINNVDSRGVLTARYAFGGNEYTVLGDVDPTNPRRVRFRVPFPDREKVFEGYMFSWETGIIAGSARVDGSIDSTGFYAYREGGLPLSLTITSPRDGGTYSWRQPLPFRAQVEHAEGDVSVRWNSNLDGLLGSGAELVRELLTLGAHRITATATSGGQSASASVNITIRNDPPTVAIVEPAGGTFCTNSPITFRAVVSDPNNNDSYPFPTRNVVWRVETTTFGTGLTASRTFTSPGSYTITVEATDDAPAPYTLSHGDKITISVQNCTNRPPTVTITNPPSDLDVYADRSDTHGWYYEITLRGSATDPEDGPLTGDALVWTTDRGDLQPGPPATGDQVLGTGTSVNVRLYTTCSMPYFGTVEHRITLTATDSVGNRTSVVRLIRVSTLC